MKRGPARTAAVEAVAAVEGASAAAVVVGAAGATKRARRGPCRLHYSNYAIMALAEPVR